MSQKMKFVLKVVQIGFANNDLATGDIILETHDIF